MAEAARLDIETNNQTWMLAQQAFPEAEAVAEQKFVGFMGGVVLAHEIQATDTADTLMEATQLAHAGDEPSRRVVNNNVASDVAERLYKVANQTEIELKFVGSRLQQEGRRLTNIHSNTFEHTVLIPEMHRRTAADLKNVLLVEALQPTGVLETHDVYIFSTTSTTMTAKQKQDYHLFADTETCSMQRFSVTGEGVSLQTAFVAGKATPDSLRHDIPTIQKLAGGRGVVIETNDGTEMMQHVMLVPKADSPNGIDDMVERYDEASAELVGQATFYGLAEPRQNYQAYAEKCRARALEFDDTVQLITDQLIAEAPAFETPLETIMRLDELSERYCVKHAVGHREINAAIFGPTSAMHIQEARFFLEQGEPERAKTSLRAAQNTADSGSCPVFKPARNPETDSDSDSGTSANSEKGGKKWMKCPDCSAKVFADPCAAVLSCWDCHAMVVNGHKTAGNGGSKARAAAKKAAEETARAELAAQVDAIYEAKGLKAETLDQASVQKSVAYN